MTPEREQKIKNAVKLTQPDLTVVLENIFDPLNISAVMRSCDAVGIREIFVIYTRDYLDKRGLVLGKRTSAGTFKWMDVYVFHDLNACIEQVRKRYGRILATLPGEHSQSLFEIDMTIPTALLFGNEDEGVSADALAACNGYFTIPQAGFAESLNISVACAVTLYEAYRQRSEKGWYGDHPKLSETQQTQLFKRWQKMLKTPGFKNRGITINDRDDLIPPIFVERDENKPLMSAKALPITKFEI